MTYKSFQDDFGFSAAQKSKVSSLTVGLEQLGSFVAAMFFYPLTNKYGRKVCIIGSTALFVIGVIIQVIKTHSLAAWYVGRIISGLGMGGQSVVIPMYSAEMTPKEIRGRCGSFYQWLYAWGVFLAYWVDYVSTNISSCRSVQLLTNHARVWLKIPRLLVPHANGRSLLVCS